MAGPPPPRPPECRESRPPLPPPPDKGPRKRTLIDYVVSRLRKEHGATLKEMADESPDAASGRKPGWYVWDYDRCEVVRGPFANSDIAGAVRSEYERQTDTDANLWIVHSDSIVQWEAYLANA